MAAKSELTLEQQLNISATAAVKAARPHLMRAWSAALRLGHRGSFDEWLLLVFSDLGDEAAEVAAGVPMIERARTAHSPWHR